MNFNIDMDSMKLNKEMQEQANKMYATNALEKLHTIFSKNRMFDTKGNSITTQGAGLLASDEAIANFFGSSKTTERMNKFLDRNFESILEQCMAKAIQHSCNRSPVVEYNKQVFAFLQSMQVLEADAIIQSKMKRGSVTGTFVVG